MGEWRPEGWEEIVERIQDRAAIEASASAMLKALREQGSHAEADEWGDDCVGCEEVSGTYVFIPDEMKGTEKHLEAQRKWREAHPEYQGNWRRANKESWNQYRKEWRHHRRAEALEHYGGNPPKCACCGEDHHEFLTIDHINGGGTRDRKAHRRMASAYEWLKAEGYPLGFRVLCQNCNASIGHYGYCPHQRKEVTEEEKP